MSPHHTRFHFVLQGYLGCENGKAPGWQQMLSDHCGWVSSLTSGLVVWFDAGLGSGHLLHGPGLPVDGNHGLKQEQMPEAGKIGEN